jgi:hypothetical protein
MDAGPQFHEPALQFWTTAMSAVPVLIEDAQRWRMRDQHIGIVRYQVPLVSQLVV